MFNFENYHYNYQAVPLLIVGISMLVGGVFVFCKNKLSRINRAFFFICLSVFVWLIATALGYMSKMPEMARICFKVDNFGVIFISINVYFFVVSFLGLRRKIVVILSYLTAFLLSVLVVTTDLLVIGVKKYYWGYFPQWGFFSGLVLLFFFSLMLASFVELIRSYGRISSSIRKNQIKYMLIAFLGAFTGSVDYLPTFGVKVYPFGYISIAFFLVVVAYSIIRYRLMDIRIVAARTAIFTFVYIPILLIPYAIGYLFKTTWVLPTLLETIFAPGGIFVYLKIQGMAEKAILQREYNQAREIRDLSGGLMRLDNIEELTRVIVGGLKRIIKTEDIALYVLNENRTSYVCDNTLKEGEEPKNIALNNTLVAYLQGYKEPIVLAEVQNKSKEVAQILTENNASLVVPAVEKGNLTGIIFLGEKPDNRAYSQIELGALAVLARQIAFAIEIIQFIEEKEEMQCARNEMQRMKEFEYLSSAIGHEIGNGIQAIELASSMLVRKRDIVSMFAENKKAEDVLKGQVANIKNNIENIRQVSEALKGYIRKGKAGEIEEVDMYDLINRTLVLARVRNRGMKGIKLIVEGSAKVFCNSTALQSVFSNLVNNSYDAIIQEKNYRVNSKSTQEYYGFIEINIKKDGDIVEVHMRDNGIGMTKEVQEQIFIPLFTTKSHENKKDDRLTGGTGIGMFTIQKMLASQGGSIKINKTEEHRGTEFLIKIKGASND